MRLLLVLIALLWPAVASAEPIAVTSTALPLNRDNLIQLRVGALRYAGGVELTSPAANFGGLSGLSVTADGQAITAVSDRGLWFTGRLERNAQGELTGVANAALFPIRDGSGDPVAIRNQTHDAESLARDGHRFIVGFERRHRLWRYDATQLDNARAEALPAPPGLSNAPVNGGIEALAVLGPGRYLAVAEELETADGNLRGWLFADGAWQDVTYEQLPGWKPTAFTVLPDGDVLAAERHFTRLGGFTAQTGRSSSRADSTSVMARPSRRRSPPTTPAASASMSASGFTAACRWSRGVLAGQQTVQDAKLLDADALAHLGADAQRIGDQRAARRRRHGRRARHGRRGRCGQRRGHGGHRGGAAEQAGKETRRHGVSLSPGDAGRRGDPLRGSTGGYA